MLHDNPNGVHWEGHIYEAKRSNNQTFIGKIVDTIGDGNYKSNILQQYSVRVLGWGVTIPNCKVATNQAGFNGTGHYSAYQKGDTVICIAKEGSIDELIIIGGVRLNGNHKDFDNEGKGLKPGELTKGAMGAGLSNQASLHPSRVTKPDSEFYLMGVNNIKAEYEDPIFGDNLETLAELQPLTGILQTRGRGGVITNYAYGGIVNYTDGNNIIVSGGTSENKCTRMLKAAKRHTEFAKQLATITQEAVTEPSFDIETAEFGMLVDADLNIINSDTTDSADIVEGLLKGTIQKQTSINALSSNIEDSGSLITNASNVSTLDTGGNFRVDGNRVRISKEEINLPKEIKSFTNIENSDKGLGGIETFENHPASPLYRQKEHLKLADQLIEAAKVCNTQAASMQQQAGMMTDQFGNAIGQAGSPGIAGSTTANPNQQNGVVNSANMSNRNVNGFINPCLGAKVFRGGGEFGDPRSYGPHSGIDFGLPFRTGSPIKAPADGVVTQAGGGKNNTIIIKHNDTFTTKYLHNSRVMVSIGQEVKQGQLIAEVGAAGTRAEHLHFDIVKNGVNVNPEIYIGVVPRQ